MDDEQPVASRAVDLREPEERGPQGHAARDHAMEGPVEQAHALERPPYGMVPEADTLGVRHIAVALQDLPFPATAKEILDRAGHWRVPVTGIHHHTLAEFMRGIPPGKRFRHPDDVARAIGKAQPDLKD